MKGEEKILKQKKYWVKNALVVNEKINSEVGYAGCAVRFMTFENLALKFKV